VIHQSGVRIDPLAHSALPDAEARVIRNLMERIDSLEGELARALGSLRELRSRPGDGTAGSSVRGVAQSLRDREILEYLGEGASEGGDGGNGTGSAAAMACWWLSDGGGI
jgi:serine O-acetyltransferase